LRLVVKLPGELSCCVLCDRWSVCSVQSEVSRVAGDLHLNIRLYRADHCITHWQSSDHRGWSHHRSTGSQSWRSASPTAWYLTTTTHWFCVIMLDCVSARHVAKMLVNASRLLMLVDVGV